MVRCVLSIGNVFPIELLVDVLPREDFDHLAAQVGVDLEPRLGWQLINIRVEQIVLQIDLLDQHTGVEQIGLIDVQIVRIIAFERLGVDKVLD